MPQLIENLLSISSSFLFLSYPEFLGPFFFHPGPRVMVKLFTKNLVEAYLLFRQLLVRPCVSYMNHLSQKNIKRLCAQASMPSAICSVPFLNLPQLSSAAREAKEER